MADAALFQAVPAGSTNGTPIGAPPANAIGVQFYLATGAAVTYAAASAQPASAPSPTWTISQATTGYGWSEKLLPGQKLFITSITGSPLFRWILGG